MKYLLGYLEGISDAPRLTDPDFQQLLVDVQAGKPQKTSDAFYDSLEKIVNELRSSPEAGPFLKPVSKRDAPDYYQYITKPMDLSTVLRNVKSHKYKNKAEFATDLDLIWKNCLTYNTTANHPLRGTAKYLQQKTNHHLEFLQDREDTNHLLSILSASGASAAVQRAVSQQPSAAGAGDEDAAGESDDAAGEDDDGKTGEKHPPPGSGDPNGRATSEVGASLNRRATSVGSAFGERRVNGSKVNGGPPSPPPFRPNLQANLDLTPALLRTPYTMTHFQPVSLSVPGPSFSDKGKAREILYGNAPPPWYPAPVGDDEDAKLEGYWWGLVGKDEAYVAGLPAVPHMVEGPPTKRRRIARRKSPSPQPNGTDNALGVSHAESVPPALVPSKPLSLERVVHRAVDKLVDARKTMNNIQEWKAYYEGDGTGLPPPPLEVLDAERQRHNQERSECKRKRQENRVEAAERFRSGGEVGEAEAALTLKRVSAGMLAHAGFEGANDIPLDLLTRVAGDYLRNLGRTLRLLMDNFAHQMTPEEIVLHTLHENGQVQLEHLESHIKDDIERDSAKISEMQRKVRQAYKELTTGPVIEDDMLFAQDGEMLQHGDFAEDLGEDFLGLRELGIDKEFGLSSLSVPKALFFGRRGRAHANALGPKVDVPDYPPPPPFIPLTASMYKSHTPGLMHAFYAERVDKGLGLETDDPFDATHQAIGPLGQIVVKPLPGATSSKKGGAKKDANGEEKKKPPKKPSQPGVGKGNWIRPSKEERERRAAEKKAELERQRAEASASAAPAADDEDAEGEEE